VRERETTASTSSVQYYKESEMSSNGGNSSCGCCGHHHSDVRVCKCLPYVDGYMMTAQIISIVAFLISLIWWETCIVGGICFISLQVIWCCRQNKIGLYISAGISFVAAIISTVAGIYIIVVWKDIYMLQGLFAVIEFVKALLWFVTSGCILYFVKSGRHAKWEEKLQAAADTDTTAAIEMGTVQHPDHDDQQQEQQSAAIAVATPSAPIAAATSYVLPDIPNKIDNV